MRETREERSGREEGRKDIGGREGKSGEGGKKKREIERRKVREIQRQKGTWGDKCVTLLKRIYITYVV